MKWDESYYPDLAGMIRDLHAMNVKLMVSGMVENRSQHRYWQRIYRDNYYIPGTEWIDFFNPAAAQALLERFQRANALPWNLCLVAGCDRTGKR